MSVDFSYKKDAITMSNDIEVIPSCFTLALFNPEEYGFVFLGDESMDDFKYNRILMDMDRYSRKSEVRHFIGEHEPDYVLHKLSANNQSDLVKFSHLIKSVLECKRIEKSKYDENQFMEYLWYNGYGYDIIMLTVAYLYVVSCIVEDKPCSTIELRRYSDFIIEKQFTPQKLHFIAEELESISNGDLNKNSIVETFNSAMYADGHIDVAILLKSNDDGDGFAPSLKKLMARKGMSIIFDDNVADSKYRVLSNEERSDFVEYNFNDVFGLYVIFQVKYVKSQLKVRDSLRESYPYTSIRYRDRQTALKWGGGERTCTAARLSGLQIKGKDRLKLKDSDAIDYDIPLPDGEVDLKDKSSIKRRPKMLWDVIKKEEKFVHEYADIYFSHFYKQDSSSHEAYERLQATQPINHKGQLNVPYYKDGEPTNAYIRLSTGGAHGGIYSGLRRMSEEAIRLWIKVDAKHDGKDVPTVDVKNILHIDFSSYYPSLLRLLGVYDLPNGENNYNKSIDGRLKLKSQLPENFHDWEPVHFLINELQDGEKLNLNSATGASNQHSKTALLPLDNKITSMRLIGNMFIYILAQRLAQEGAFIISTNTDGLYISGLTIEIAEKVCDDFFRVYGIEVAPEPLERFINRDASNRVEFQKDKKTNVLNISKAGGELRHATGELTFLDSSMSNNVSYPLICGKAVLEYMKQDDWLTKPYDPSFIRNYIESIHAKGKDYLEAWYVVFNGSRIAYMTLNDENQPKISRVVMTKEGGLIGKLQCKNLTKDDAIQLFVNWNKNGAIPKGRYESVFEDAMSDSKTFKISFLERVSAKKGRKAAVYKEVIIPESDVLDGSRISELWASENIYTLGFYDEVNKAWLPIRKWQKVKLTNFPTERAMVLQSFEELQSLDFENLNLDAYVSWSETMLQSWKKTNKLEEIGLDSCDDFVNKKQKSKKVTKKEKDEDFIKSLYGL